MVHHLDSDWCNLANKQSNNKAEIFYSMNPEKAVAVSFKNPEITEFS